MNKHNSGRSLTEILLVMGIAMTLAVAAFRLYGDAMERTRRIRLQSQVAEIERRVNLEWAGRNWGRGTDADRNRRLRDRGVDLTTPWGGEISIVFSEGESGVRTLTRPFFGVEIPGLNRARCIWAASSFQPGSICLSINTAGAAATCKRDPAQFLDACHNNDNNRVIVRFRKT